MTTAREAAELGDLLWEEERDVEDEILALGTCQICGHYTTDRYCYATDRCKEVGGGEVM